MTTTPYAIRRRNGQGQRLRDHGNGPEKQPIEYYREVGWSRTRRGKKTPHVELIGTQFITYRRSFRDPTLAPSEPAFDFQPLKFKVESQRRVGTWYKVLWTGRVLSSSCTCLDYKWGQACKHIRAVRRWRKKQRNSLVEKEELEDELLDESFEEATPKDVGNKIEEVNRQVLIATFGGD